MAAVAARRRAAPARVAAAAPPRPRRLVPLLRLAPSGRSLLFALLLLVLGAGAYTGARETSVFAVTTIDVRGARAPLADDVASALEGLNGASLVALGERDVERRLARLPWVAEIAYDRAFPHTLRVFVTPERPLAVLRRGADAWLVSARGRVLEEMPRAARPLLPRVWLPARAEPRVGRVAPVEAAAAVRALAPAAGGPFLRRVRFVRLGEESVTLVLRSGLEVRLGEPNDVPLKLEIARRILPSLLAPGYVDLSVPERPVAADNSQVGG